MILGYLKKDRSGYQGIQKLHSKSEFPKKQEKSFKGGDKKKNQELVSERVVMKMSPKYLNDLRS